MPQDNISELYNTYGKEVFTNENEFRSYVTTPQGAKDFYSNFAKEAFSSDKEFNNFIGLGKTQPPSSPAVGGGSKLVGGAGVKSTTSPSLGGGGSQGKQQGTPDFGFGGVVEKIGKPRPAMEEVALQEQPQAQPIDGRINVQLNADEILGGGDKNAMMKGLEVKPPTSPLENYTARSKEIDKITDLDERRFEKGQQFEELAALKQGENKQLASTLNELAPIIEQQSAQLQQMQQQLADPNLDPNTRSQMQQVYNEQLANTQEAAKEHDKLLEQFNANARFAADMLKASNSMGGSRLAPGESVAAGVWNSTVPAMTKAAGSILDFFGGFGGYGMIKEVKDENGNVITPQSPLQIAGNAVMRMGEDMERDLSKDSKKFNVSLLDDMNPENVGYMGGQVVGSALNTVVGSPGGALGMGLSAGTQVLGNTYIQAKDAGLNSTQAMLFSLPMAIVSGKLAPYGVETMASKLFSETGKTSLREAVKGLENASVDKIMKASTNWAKNVLENTVIEGGTGAVEGTTEYGLQALAEGVTDADFKRDPTLRGFLRAVGENAMVEAAGGTGMSAVLGTTPNKTVAQIANEAVNNPEREQKFMDDLDTFEQAGDITPEQKQKAADIFNKAKAAVSTIPPNVVNASQRTRATELILEQEEVAAQVENTNPAMQAPLIERQKAIDAELAEIAANPTPESPMFEIGSEGKTEVVDLTPKAEEAKANQAKGETVTVYHGGEYGDKSGNLYVTQDKGQAQEYAKGNEGDVIKYTLDKSKIATEDDFTKAFEEEGIDVNEELKLFELIDERFETALSEDEKEKVFNNLRKKGFDAAAFTDEDLSLRNKIGVENIVIFDSEGLQSNSVQVKENRAYELLDEGYKPLIDGEVKNDFTEDDIGDYFRNNDTIEMVGPNTSSAQPQAAKEGEPTKTKQDESTKQGGTTTPPTSERVTGDQGKTESATQGDAQNAEAANRQAGVPSQENELAPTAENELVPTAPTSQSVSIFQELDKVPSQSKGKRAKAERAKFDKKHGEKAKQARDINANFAKYEKKLMDEGVITKKEC